MVHQPPVTDEIAAAIARFFPGGIGPPHSVLSTAITGAGYGADDPFNPTTRTPSKQHRVLTVFRAAQRRPDRARQLVEALLAQMRVEGRPDETSSKSDRMVLK